MKLPLDPSTVVRVVRGQMNANKDERPLVVAGALGLVGTLRRELIAGGEEQAVAEGGTFQGAAGLLYVLAGPVTETDERELKAARKARVPVVVVQTDPGGSVDSPSVLPTEIVTVKAGRGFPIDEIARVLARRLAERGPALAARLPVLRKAVCEELISRVSRQNAVIGLAVFIPGANFPALTLNQLRLVLQIGHAHGFEVTPKRLPEAVGVVAGGLGLRALARELLGLVPVGGWIVKGGIAFAGTRALGEAAVRYYESQLVEVVEALG